MSNLLYIDAAMMYAFLYTVTLCIKDTILELLRLLYTQNLNTNLFPVYQEDNLC